MLILFALAKMKSKQLLANYFTVPAKQTKEWPSTEQVQRYIKSSFLEKDLLF